ncbi:Forkhead-associated (FHA) domain protein [Cordyceps fumosorosea ARSEF 2679]|uniref:Forkhead-associated (FHA) domain protein n=1 Tax=Cordyceps fumosorosea (strain ARSEF 2679) TaxID=1081104 RepID=A0A167PMK5_CORFA|nr:Forkhead-associated (FHA) domain protein [Cordyceps fumosorosea ARSEF 2679]OAA56823.1 Forkhead-associated (FHA) domain protein [Cordyceps fumosorosea ARSEF 2679]
MIPPPSQDIIAWLVPAPNCPAAEEAVHMPENASGLVPCAETDFLRSRIRTSLLADGPPRHALALTFAAQPPRRRGRFVLGTDPRLCDVVLPRLDGIAPQHCSLGFDGLSRLTLDDSSEAGTQVWYDWDCAGDLCGHSWPLTGGYAGGFPSDVRCITVDIQGVRFQVVANDHSADRDAFAAKVDALCAQAEPAAAQLDALWSEPPLCISPLRTLAFSALPVLRHIIVKSLGSNSDGEVYLWDMERPWEPMVKASA